jgi:hypothetical protein
VHYENNAPNSPDFQTKKFINHQITVLHHVPAGRQNIKGRFKILKNYTLSIAKFG